MITVIYQEKVYCQSFDFTEISKTIEDLVNGGAAEKEISVFTK